MKSWTFSASSNAAIAIDTSWKNNQRRATIPSDSSCRQARGVIFFPAMRILLLLTFLLICIPVYAADPCTKATPDCTRQVNLGGESRARLLYLSARQEKGQNRSQR